MKTAKILAVTFLMSIFCGTLLYAQQGQKPQRTVQTPDERVGKRVEMMKKSLNLTDEQAAKVQEAQKQMLGDVKQIQAKNKANREEMKAKAEAYNAQLKTILTPEQYQKYQEHRKNMRKDMKKAWQGKHQKAKRWAK